MTTRPGDTSITITASEIGTQAWTHRVCKLKKSRGWCNYRGKVLNVADRLSQLEKTEVSIHELLHAIFPWIDEFYVQEAARDLTAMLLALDYLSDEHHD